MSHFYDQSFHDLLVSKGKDDEKYILSLFLNNPDSRNTITTQMIDSLCSVLKFADFDSEVRVIVLKGMGKSFCAGGDIKAMADKNGMFSGEPNELRLNYEQGIQQIPRTIESLQTPIIAVVEGAAIGAGCDLTAMCDLRIATDKAIFAETFSKLSLVPGDGGTWFLQRVIGYTKALEMFLTGDIYDAKQAFKMGLVQYLVSEDEVEFKVRELALKISKNAPVALSLTKKAMKLSYLSNLDQSLDLLSAYQGIAQRTADHFEGIAAFKNKKPANFTHK